MLSPEKGREVSASKQTGVLAFLPGTALDHALGWPEGRLIVGLEPPIHLFLHLLSLSLLNSSLFPSSVPYSGHRACSRDWKWNAYRETTGIVQASGPGDDGRRGARKGSKVLNSSRQSGPPAFLPHQQNWSQCILAFCLVLSWGQQIH